MNRKIVLIGVLTLFIPVGAQAQTATQEPAVTDLQKQLQEMRSQMNKMQSRIDELEAAKANPGTNLGPQPAAPQNPATTDQSLRELDGRLRNLEEPKTFHYKGLTMTPGGFLESTVLVRTRNENADVADNYSGIPLNGSSNSKLSEFRGTARGSQLSLLIQGAAGDTKLKGYVEADFLGAAPTANYVQSSAWTPRLRQAWVQIDRPSGWTITAGQMWSLLTSNRQGIANLTELKPMGVDGNFVVGFTWTRERAVRVTKNFNDRIWAAFAVEDPESTYSAAFVPPNIMGLNTSQNASTGVNLLPFLANYSNGQSTTLAPDLVAKVAFEPGWGHFEIKALGRFFRDRIASTATANGHTNTTEGYGFGFSALLPVVKTKLDVSLEGLAGQGIGRYGASGLPDVTLDPITGAMRPLREARIMGGIQYHRNSRLDLYAYGGDEYTGRYAFRAVDSTGTVVPAGYGSSLASYAACTNEVALNTCGGANRNIWEATAGYWYRLYRGEFGRIEYGNQIVYMHRNLWSGIGHTPQGGEFVVFSTIRFYLP
ncbi:MAG TPA: hypothetical protein VFI45_14665 [Candidatus Acidoferrum sp.]|nr:hypothetical protein [Candidatus Acidoferrum sp.]